MKKKLLALCLSLLLFVPSAALAYTYANIRIVGAGVVVNNYQDNTGRLVLVRYDPAHVSDKTTLVLESCYKVGGSTPYPMVSIDPGSFDQFGADLETLVLPDTLIDIQPGALSGCTHPNFKLYCTSQAVADLTIASGLSADKITVYDLTDLSYSVNHTSFLITDLSKTTFDISLPCDTSDDTVIDVSYGVSDPAFTVQDNVPPLKDGQCAASIVLTPPSPVPSKTYTLNFTRAAHTLAWRVKTPASKLASGVEEQVCSVCHTVSASRPIAKLPYVASAEDNKIDVPATLVQGQPLAVTVHGAGMDNTQPLQNDVRYLPVSLNGTPFSNGAYTQTLQGLPAGACSITVVYQRQIYDGAAWVDAGQTEQTVSVDVQAAVSPSPVHAVPTGDATSPWALSFALIASAFGLCAVCFAKRRLSR